jgi:hypothetical protein
VAFLVRHEIALEGKFHPAFAFDRLSAELLVVSQIDFDVKPFATFLAPVHFLALRVLSPKVAPQLVKPDKCFPANRAPRRDLLVVPGRPGSGGAAPLRQINILRRGRIMRLVVHFQRLGILESLVATAMGALEGSPVLYQIDRHGRNFIVFIETSRVRIFSLALSQASMSTIA